MKKIFFAGVLVMIMVDVVNAQHTVNTGFNTAEKYGSGSTQFSSANENNAVKGVPVIGYKVLHEFSKFCKAAQNVYWEILTDGAIAYYKTGDQKGRRFYNQKGNFICNILSCKEKHLPGDITSNVKAAYNKDCEIIAAEDIKTPVKQFYFIYIKSKAGVKKLSVCDGEINVVQEYSN